MHEVNLRINEGALVMGIHYDYKSTRGDKAMKKEAKRKARIEERKSKRSPGDVKESKAKIMHDIDKPITLEDLTNPDKEQLLMKSFEKKDSLLIIREAALKKNLKKRKKFKKLTLKKNVSSIRQVD